MAAHELSDFSKDLFDMNKVILLDRAPTKDDLQPDNVAINCKVVNSYKDRKFAQKNIPYRVLTDICQDIQEDGFLGPAMDSAIRTQTSLATIHRWRVAFAKKAYCIAIASMAPMP